MTGIEAMFDAMQAVEGLGPTDLSRRNRNPLNLRAAATVPHTMDAGGYCVFASIVDGTQAGLHELWCKVTGNNEHGIGPSSTLDELFDVYAPRGDDNNPSSYALTVASRCSSALGRTVTHLSQLRDVCPETINAATHAAPLGGKTQ